MRTTYCIKLAWLGLEVAGCHFQAWPPRFLQTRGGPCWAQTVTALVRAWGQAHRLASRGFPHRLCRHDRLTQPASSGDDWRQPLVEATGRHAPAIGRHVPTARRGMPAYRPATVWAPLLCHRSRLLGAGVRVGAPAKGPSRL